ncbi:CDP-alcohol phosphatidyltransferase family protein [Olsenella sp. HMSC062G07]|uniref:CDP-alcohol phosphatidyltransferase family protein n=1 Tax=Olsenella sp. HMSC062G07 TaxID=1739330 RepID=UPI001FEEA25A|nr:CDP-alcohol phosphatidyltransferase family protein [Olsenella sp. HMSC062G07]
MERPEVSEKTTRMLDDVRGRVDPDVLAAQQRGSVAAPVGTPDNPSDRVLTLANLITACRLALTVAFLALFVSGVNRSLALVCYAVAALTDFVDGQVARRTQTVSWLGKIMDPVMDRVLLFTGVLGLMATGELPAWVAAFVILRDGYLFVGTLILQRYRRRPVDVIYIGKVTTALLMSGFVLMLFGVPHMGGLGVTGASWLPVLNAHGGSVGVLLVYAGVVLSAITAGVYTTTGIRIMRRARATRRSAEGEAS